MAMRLKVAAMEPSHDLLEGTYICADSNENFRQYLQRFNDKGRSGALFSPDPLRHLPVLPNFQKYWYRSTVKGYEKRGAVLVGNLGEYLKSQMQYGNVVAIERLEVAQFWLSTRQLVEALKTASETAAKKKAFFAAQVNPRLVEERELAAILCLEEHF
jgi:hypothetical protein